MSKYIPAMKLLQKLKLIFSIVLCNLKKKIIFLNMLNEKII